MKLITMSMRVIYNERLAGASEVLLQFTFINKTVLIGAEVVCIFI